jgi:hypothetical protein
MYDYSMYSRYCVCMYYDGEHLPGTGTMAMQLVAWCVGVGVQHMDQLLKGTVSN